MRAKIDTPDLAIFYADGSIIECSNEDQTEITITFKVSKDFLNAPSQKVQAIVQRDEFSNRHVLRGKDHYFPLPNGMINSANDLSPFFDYYFPGLFKYGVCLTDEYWAKVMSEVKKYKKIPRAGAPIKLRPDDDL